MNEQNDQADSSTTDTTPTSLLAPSRRTSTTSIETETPREAHLKETITELRDEVERLKELLSTALGQHRLTGSQLTRVPYGCTPSLSDSAGPSGNLTHREDWIPTPFAFPSPVDTVMSAMAHSGPAGLDNTTNPVSVPLEPPNLRDHPLNTPTYSALGEQQLPQISPEYDRSHGMKEISSIPPSSTFFGPNLPPDFQSVIFEPSMESS